MLRGAPAGSPRAGADGSAYPLVRRPGLDVVDGVAESVIAGAMASDDDWFDSGLREVCRAILAADRDPAVVGHLVRFDSGGGFVSAGQLVADTLASLKKPRIAHVAYACSAAYMAACACDEVMLVDELATVGSIGVMQSWPAWFLEYYAVIQTDIYARTSDEKNAEFRALVGDRDHGPTKDHLDLLDAAFVAHVKRSRDAAQGISIDDDALRGGVYVGRDAIARGLADSVGNYAHARRRLAQISPLNPVN